MPAAEQLGIITGHTVQQGGKFDLRNFRTNQCFGGYQIKLSPSRLFHNTHLSRVHQLGSIISGPSSQRKTLLTYKRHTAEVKNEYKWGSAEIAVIGGQTPDRKDVWVGKFTPETRYQSVMSEKWPNFG